MSTLLHFGNRTISVSDVRGIYFDELSEVVDIYLVEGDTIFSTFEKTMNSGNIEKFLESPEMVPFEIFNDRQESIGVFAMNLYSLIAKTFEVEVFKSKRGKTHMTFSVDGESFYTILKTKHFNQLVKHLESVNSSLIN